ncbi:MAG: AAA family ATPase, partial [Solirubrobacteraceae bacterium]
DHLTAGLTVEQFTAVPPPAEDTAPAATPDRYHGRVLDVAALLAAPDTPVPWRCAGLAADGYLSVVAGRGGEGKSWLTLALACGVARGQPAAGIPCKKGKAILFDAENGAPLIARRLRAAGVTGEMAVQPVEVGGLSFAKDSAWFRRVIDEHKPQLVIFDSLRVLSSGSKESDSDEMEPVITRLKQLARDTGCAIVLVHHRGKAEGSDYRGSSVILDQADLLFTLGRERGDPEGRHRRKLATVKCRIDEEPAPRWVAIQADRSRGLVTVDEAEPYEADEGARPRDTLREDVLGKLGGISQSGARIARALGRGKADGTVRRVLEDLQADGLAEKRTDGWGLPTPAPLGGGNPGNPPETPVSTGVQGLPPQLATPGNPWQPVEATGRLADLCRCDRPLAAPDQDGDLRCARCGHACDGWDGAA